MPTPTPPAEEGQERQDRTAKLRAELAAVRAAARAQRRRIAQLRQQQGPRQA